MFIEIPHPKHAISSFRLFQVLALSNLEVVGQIRTPIEYLVELLRTEVGDSSAYKGTCTPSKATFLAQERAGLSKGLLTTSIGEGSLRFPWQGKNYICIYETHWKTRQVLVFTCTIIHVPGASQNWIIPEELNRSFESLGVVVPGISNEFHWHQLVGWNDPRENSEDKVWDAWDLVVKTWVSVDFFRLVTWWRRLHSWHVTCKGTITLDASADLLGNTGILRTWAQNSAWFVFDFCIWGTFAYSTLKLFFPLRLKFQKVQLGIG